MSYTVKKLSELSGVSVRALHWYDKIGLLKPEHYGENNYRYYGEEQLSKLKTILFFRELGLPLSDIQTIIACSDSEQIESLLSHKKSLEVRANEINQLIDMISIKLNLLKANK